MSGLLDQGQNNFKIFAGVNILSEIDISSRVFPPHWQSRVFSPLRLDQATSFSFLLLIDPTLRPFEVRDWVIWEQRWEKFKDWPIRGQGYHQLTNKRPRVGWHDWHDPMEDHCRNKERHLSGEIFQGLAKNISLTSWHIPWRSVHVTNSGHYTRQTMPSLQSLTAASSAKRGRILCCLGLFHPRTGYLCLRISLMLRRDTIIALRTFVQSASSLTALTTSINNIKSNIIIGSYCDSRSHLYISDHQISPLHTTLCKLGILSNAFKNSIREGFYTQFNTHLHLFTY